MLALPRQGSRRRRKLAISRDIVPLVGVRCGDQRYCHSSIVSLTRSAMTAGSSSKANNTARSKPCGPVMSTRTPPRNGSAAIHPSYCSLTCLPPASTAVSIRSRRVAGISLRVEDDQRVTHSRAKKIHSARTFAESEPRFSKRSAVPQLSGWLRPASNKPAMQEHRRRRCFRAWLARWNRPASLERSWSGFRLA